MYIGGDIRMRRPSVIFLLALSAGIWWQLKDVTPALYVSLLLMLSIIFDPSKKKGFFILVGLALGIGLTQLQLTHLETLNQQLAKQTKFNVSGTVYQRDLLDPNSCWLKTSNGLWVRLRFSPYKPMPTISSGMNANITGTYLPAEPARNPGGFNEKRWLYAKKGVGSVEVSAVKILAGGSALEQWRHKLGMPLVNDVLQNTAFKQGPMAAGMLFGEDSWIPPEVLEAYKTSGTNHILSVSGAHFGILLFWVYQFFEHRHVGYRHKKIIIWSLLGVFIWLIGADSAAIRAYYMFLVLDLARLSYKQPDALNGLSLTLVIMLLLNPMMIWDVGLHLAFAAMYGLLVIAPFIRKGFSFEMGKWSEKLFQSLILSLSACLCLYPILCTQFNNFTWWSLIYNLPVSILSAISLPLSGAVALFTWLKPLSRGIGLIGGASIWLMTETVKTSLLLPAQKAMPSLSTVQFALYVSVLLLPLYFKQISTGVNYMQSTTENRLSFLGRISHTFLVIITGAALLLGQWIPEKIHFGNELQVYFLDVGQGDGTVIKTPTGKVIVVDTGLEKGRLLVSDSLLKLGIDQVDLLIVSHPHSDHIGGAKQLMEKLNVKAFAYFNGHYAPEEALALKALTGLGKDKGTIISTLSKGDEINVEQGLLLKVLHPDKEFDSESANDESIAFELLYGETSFLFTGDISTQVECDIIGKVQAAHMVLKVPHHGSATSSSEALTSMDNLELAVIQVGKKNRYGHPKASTLERYKLSGVPILRNDYNGCVQLYSDGKQLWYGVQIQED